MAKYKECETIKKSIIECCGDFTEKDAEYIVERIPDADVVEVKYGKWEKRKTIIFDSVKVGYNCSECNTTWDTGTPYCPNCGAKMDGERKCNND